MERISAEECFAIACAFEMVLEAGRYTGEKTGSGLLLPKGQTEAQRLYDLFLRLSEVPENEYPHAVYHIEREDSPHDRSMEE